VVSFAHHTQAGASARDALRSIIISEQLLGTEEILLIKHTGCGMLTFKNEDAYALVEKNLGYGRLPIPSTTRRADLLKTRSWCRAQNPPLGLFAIP